MHPSPILDTYWRFAAERQAIYFRRFVTPEGPWTSDPILSAYRFTNAYRATDRVSQYLIREVQYRSDRPQTPRELFFRILLFKIFNRIETWEAIEQKFGPLVWGAIDLDNIDTLLDSLLDRGQRIYSAAYIMPTPRLGKLRKHSNHLALIKAMIDDRLPERIVQAPSLRSIYEMLSGYPGVGPFLAFQYTIDLNYSDMLTFDEGDFVVPGPGAVDGIAKCFENIGKHSLEEVIYAVADKQESAFKILGLNFQSLFGRRLQPVDCQNLFCEVSKYTRVAYPEIRGVSGRTRIKQSFRASTRALAKPLFPRRWEIQNQRL